MYSDRSDPSGRILRNDARLTAWLATSTWISSRWPSARIASPGVTVCMSAEMLGRFMKGATARFSRRAVMPG